MGFSLPYSSTIAVLFICAIIVQTFGELVVLHEPDNGETRKLTCISEDDDSALIWNYNLNKTMPNFRKNIITDFEPRKPLPKSVSECAMWNFSGCSTGWGHRKGWDVVNSALRPMGPVLDYRWEGLREFVFEKLLDIEEYQYVGKVNESSLTTVFSVRGLRDIYIFLCDKKDPMLGSCLWIILGGWGNKQSAIRFCDKAPDPRTPPSNINCTDIFLVEHEVGKIVQPYEWRTFTLKWINQTKTIQVFRETDHENEPFLRAYLAKRGPVSHMSIRSGIETRVRHHFYEYWLTERENSTLNTEAFGSPAEHFCVEVLVGLCPECKLNFRLIDSKGYDLNIMTSISGNRKSVYNELLTWESIELEMDVKNLRSKSVKLEITTILKKNGGKGQWAIDKFRTCRPVGGIRKSNITIHRDSLSGSWLQVNCQKLSHNRKQNAVVNSLSTIMNDEDINQSQPFLEKWIRSGGSSGKNVDKGWSFCNSIGCMCTQGFMGNNCNESELCLKGIPVGGDHLKVIMSSHSKGCRALRKGSYSLEVHDSSGNMSQAPFFDPVFPYDIKNLRPYTKYKLILLNTQNNTVWTAKVRTRQSAPGKVLNLRHGKVSDKEVTLKWGAPKETNGIITKYTVSIKRIKLLGCENLKRPTPPAEELEDTVEDTTAFISGLHPYAIYKVVVIAYTIKPGPEESWEFETSATEYPTSRISNLRLSNNQTRLEWDKPENCTDISGPIGTKVLFFAGLSSWTNNDPPQERQTHDDYFDLSNITFCPYTTYRVYIHLARDNRGIVSPNVYQKKIWTTPPSSPLAVTDLKVFDADSEEKRISLLWKPPPHPPTGEIESYHVIIGNKNLEKASPGKCDLWADSICLENVSLLPNSSSHITVQIYAKNRDVERNGDWANLTFAPKDVFNKPPNHPENFTYNFMAHGIVELNWEHPFSPTRINQFLIFVEYINTNLLKEPNETKPSLIIYHVAKKPKKYNEKLHLAPSTEYKIAISSYSRNSSSRNKTERISVPAAFGFSGDEELQVIQKRTLIHLEIPAITNATQNSTVKVTIDGPLTCTKNTSQFNETHLLIDAYNITESSPKRLTIGTDQPNKNNLNCSLSRGEIYNITVFVTNQSGIILGTVKKMTHTMEKEIDRTLVLSIILTIVAIGLIVSFIWRRKLLKFYYKRSKNNPTYPKIVRRTNNWIVVFTRNILARSPNSMEPRALSHIYAVPFEYDSRVVNTDYFPEYVKKGADSGLLLSQFSTFPRDLTKPCQYGKLPQNMPKNRAKNLIAYDDTRVVLQKFPDDPYSDYINASYIQGHRGEKAYIATQGPMPNTTNDFWRMIWQEKVYVICMLTNLVENGKTKCEQYWPAVGIKVKHGDVSVLNTGHQVFADYTIRNFRLGCQKYKRKITQLHYTGWPDHGIPTYFQSLVAYLNKLQETPTGNGPIVIHCDTGDGRTGTLILCDICLRQGDEEKTIDVLAVTTQMRESRANMVGTPQQYLLAHIVIAEGISASITQLPCTEDLPKRIKKLRRQLPSDIKRLHDTEWQERTLYALVTPRCPTPGDFARERLPELDSIYPDVIYFERYSRYQSEKSHYIGAVSVDGVKAKKQYLASQLPSTSTWSKFWLLIARNNIQLVIILQSADPNDSNCCNILPHNSNFAPVPSITVETKSCFCEEDQFTIEELLLTDSSGDEERPQSVNVLTCTGWEQGLNGKPPTPAMLVSLWRASGKIPRKESPSLVLCHDGVTGCGLYLALNFLLERMAIERECDVISAVRAVRRFRPEFVQSVEQFEYLYDAAVNYAECFQTYANFS